MKSYNISSLSFEMLNLQTNSYIFVSLVKKNRKRLKKLNPCLILFVIMSLKNHIIYDFMINVSSRKAGYVDVMSVIVSIICLTKSEAVMRCHLHIQLFARIESPLLEKAMSSWSCVMFDIV